MKKWLVLVYANGNNELEPEMWDAVQKLCEVTNEDKIEVIIQIGRQPKGTTQLIRPMEEIVLDAEDWSGVRRYKVDEGKLTLIEELGSVNMADPKVLYSFILWARKNHGAEHSALIIGGHIYQFVGIMPDFTQDRPYIMGFPELDLVVHKACQEIGTNIDLLVLDTCYAASYEVLCEWAQYDEIGIDLLLTYRGKGPIEGLPYHVIIEALTQVNREDEKAFMEHLIQELHGKGQLTYPLIAIKLDPYVLRVCKDMFHKLATAYNLWYEQTHTVLTPYEIMTTVDQAKPWYQYVEYIQVMHSMFLLNENEEDTLSDGTRPIHVLSKVIPDQTRKDLYKRLYFTKANAWAKLVCDEPHACEQLEQLQPLAISRLVLYAFICNMNTTLSSEQQESITKQLIALKQWNI